MKKSNLTVFKEIEKKRPRSFHTLKNRALKGDTDAAFHLAFVYFKGLTENRKSTGVKFIKQAATANHPQALWVLGMLYFKDLFVLQNKSKAYEYMELASHAGCADAQAFTAIHLIQNHNSNSQENAGFKLAKIAAEKESPQGFYNLGYCALKGIGQSKDLDQAYELFSKAATMAHTDSFFALANLCFNRQFKDYEKAFTLLEAAAYSGHVKALDMLGACYYGGTHTKKDYEKAYTFWSLSGTSLPPTLQAWVQKSGAGFIEKTQLNVQQFKLCLQKSLIDQLHLST